MDWSKQIGPKIWRAPHDATGRKGPQVALQRPSALGSMTTVIETSNGWAVVRERDRHVLADGFRIGGVGLIVKTANRSRAPNTWRGELDWRRARLHGRPTRSVKDEQRPSDRDAASRWLAKQTTSRQRRVRRADGQGRVWRKCDRASRPRQSFFDDW